MDVRIPTRAYMKSDREHDVRARRLRPKCVGMDVVTHAVLSIQVHEYMRAIFSYAELRWPTVLR